jgi:outer membrane murein-binding lipoprotein Lpp
MKNKIIYILFFILILITSGCSSSARMMEIKRKLKEIEMKKKQLKEEIKQLEEEIKKTNEKETYLSFSKDLEYDNISK